ncbi:MAG: ribonuclease P protein component 1 [Candidatus Aenigmatarchaeota archaeon]
MRTVKNLPRHEIIGLEVEVIESSNTDEQGLSGKVVDEQENVLKIEADVEVKTVQKSGRKFVFELPSGKKVKVSGDLIQGKPEERIKKRLKKW